MKNLHGIIQKDKYQKNFDVGENMGDIYIYKDGKRIWGSDGNSGYEDRNEIVYAGKTFYKDGNNGYFCPENGRTYHVGDGHISSLEDGIIGTITDAGVVIHNKSKARSNNNTSKGIKQPYIGDQAGWGVIVYYLITALKRYVFTVGFFSWFFLFGVCLVIPMIITNDDSFSPTEFGVIFVISILLYFALRCIGNYINKSLGRHLKGWILIGISCCAIGLFCLIPSEIKRLESQVVTYSQTSFYDNFRKKHDIESIEMMKTYEPICILVSIASAGIFCVINKKRK